MEFKKYFNLLFSILALAVTLSAQADVAAPADHINGVCAYAYQGEHFSGAVIRINP